MTFSTNKNWLSISITLLLILICTCQSFSQKRRKSDDDSPAGLKQREAEFYFTEGEKFYILEDYAKALTYYQRAIESDSENGTIYYKIADVLAKSSRQDDLAKAATNIETALRFEKKNKFFYLLAANIYNGLAKFEKSAEAYENMIREVKGTEEYLFELAAVYQYGNQTDDAIKTYNKAEDVFGVNEASSIQKMRLLIESGKVKEGIAEGEKLIKTFPDEEPYIMAFTEVLSQKGMRNEAISYIEKFVASHPNAVDASMLLAGFYRDTNQEQRARPMLVDLFGNDQLEVRSKLIMMGAYVNELNNLRTKKSSDPDKEAFTLTLFEKLKTLHPNIAEVHVIGGDLYLATGKNREAQKEYLLATEAGDVNFEVWQNLLFLEIQLEQFEQATQHAELALEMFPNQPMLHYFNGFAQLRNRMFDESIYSFEQAKKLAPANQSLIAEVNGLLGDAYHATKQHEKSDKAFDDALATNPNNYAVLNNYSYYLTVRKEELEKAEKMSSSLVKNNPENPTFLDTHAWVLYTRQKYKEAKKFIEKAISTGKANAAHFEHYGDILYQLGEVDQAVVQWEKARGLNAKSDTLNKKIANRKIYE